MVLKAVIIAKQFKPDLVQFTSVLTKVDLLPVHHIAVKLLHGKTQYMVCQVNPMLLLLLLWFSNFKHA